MNSCKNLLFIYSHARVHMFAGHKVRVLIYTIFHLLVCVWPVSVVRMNCWLSSPMSPMSPMNFPYYFVQYFILFIFSFAIDPIVQWTRAFAKEDIVYLPYISFTLNRYCVRLTVHLDFTRPQTIYPHNDSFVSWALCTIFSTQTRWFISTSELGRYEQA